MSGRYPPRNPKLPAIPGVTLAYLPSVNTVHSWVAWRTDIDWEFIAKSPWKKQTWKMAQYHMTRMG